MLDRLRWWWRRRTLRPAGFGHSLTRVRLPSTRPVEADTLRRLRAVRDELDLYVLPDRRVWLLEHQPGKQHIREAQQTMARGGIQHAQTLLMADGFRCLAELPPFVLYVPELIVRRAQIAVACSPVEREQAFADALDISDGTAYQRIALQVMREKVRADARSDHRIVFRRRVSIVKPDWRDSLLRLGSPTTSRA